MRMTTSLSFIVMSALTIGLTGCAGQNYLGQSNKPSVSAGSALKQIDRELDQLYKNRLAMRGQIMELERQQELTPNDVRLAEIADYRTQLSGVDQEITRLEGQAAMARIARDAGSDQDFSPGRAPQVPPAPSTKQAR